MHSAGAYTRNRAASFQGDDPQSQGSGSEISDSATVLSQEHDTYTEDEMGAFVRELEQLILTE